MGAISNASSWPDGAATAPLRRLDDCTPGIADGFGDRLLTFDEATATSIEFLKFKPEFSNSLAFGAALRERVEQLRSLQDPSIASARGVEHIDGDGLLLVSKYVAGRRLSELMPRSQGPVFAAEFIRQIAPVLATLTQGGRHVGHGALTLDRVVATHEGRLVVLEAAVGAAVESLAWPAARVHSQLELAVPTSGKTIRYDDRLDVIQLGFLALSLLLGRRLDASDYPAKVAALLDESAADEAGGTWAASRLRTWIERALQIGPRPLESARDAHAALGELPRDGEFRQTERRTVVAFTPLSEPVPGAPAAVLPPRPAAPPATTALLPPVAQPAPIAQPVAIAQPDAIAETAPVTESIDVVEMQPPARRRLRSWILGAVTVLAVAEAVGLATMSYLRTAPVVVEVSAPALPAAAPLIPAPLPATDRVETQAAATAAPPVPTPAPAVEAAAAGRSPDGFGGITLSSPIDLQVFEGGKLIGSTSGPIAVIEGVHTLDLVNDALGYRARETVTVKAGQLASRTLAVPAGRVSINAVPWADVWIDGTPAGQTPLANLSIPIGQHEIVFRHPQLPEQRQTAVVKFDGLTRVSAVMQR